MLNFVQPHLSGSAIDMYEDNEEANALLAENVHGFHRSKYVHLRFHFLWGLVRLQQVVVHSSTSAEQHVDIPIK